MHQNPLVYKENLSKKPENATKEMERTNKPKKETT